MVRQLLDASGPFVASKGGRKCLRMLFCHMLLFASFDLMAAG
jgi:hypothetical protein